MLTPSFSVSHHILTKDFVKQTASDLIGVLAGIFQHLSDAAVRAALKTNSGLLRADINFRSLIILRSSDTPSSF